MKKVIMMITVLFLSSCKTDKSPIVETNIKTITNENINLIITPDLSNRIEGLYPKPVSDVELITSIYRNYYPDIYRIKHRVMGQEDVIQFKFTNPAIIKKFKINLEGLTMDLSKMNLSQRIDFLANGGNDTALKTVDFEVQNIYTKALENVTGGDVYNYFKKEVTSTLIKKNKDPQIIDDTIIETQQRNIIVLLTDGYIEAGLFGAKNCHDKKCLYLSKVKVNQFRNEFLASGKTDLKDFFKNSGYGIIPIENKNLANTEVFVSEMYDRSLNIKTGSQTVSPNDYEIMQLFWSDWLEKSGVKHYKLLSTANTEEDFLNELKLFIKEG